MPEHDPQVGQAAASTLVALVVAIPRRALGEELRQVARLIDGDGLLGLAALDQPFQHQKIRMGLGGDQLTDRIRRPRAQRSPRRVGLGAQQTMQRAGLGGNQRFLRVGQRQFSQRRAQRFGQARRRFPRRRRQTNTTARTVFNLD